MALLSQIKEKKERMNKKINKQENTSASSVCTCELGRTLPNALFI